MSTNPFQIETQKELNWCWAAVGVSIDRYFSPTSRLKQCQLAQEVLNLPGGCCDDPSNCNLPGDLEEALKARSVKRLKKTLTGGILTFREIQGQIDACNPVCARIGWQDETRGHFVVIYGYSSSSAGEWVSIADPYFLDSTVPYTQFVNSYLDVGVWTDTFLVEAASS
jgi:hypothetical protein